MRATEAYESTKLSLKPGQKIFYFNGEYMSNELLVKSEFTLQSYASDLKAKLEFCKYLQDSALCPKHFKSPQDVLACILYGQENGLTPMHALQTLYIVNGIPTLPSAGIKAKVIAAGGKYKKIKWDETVCHLSLSRGEWIEDFEYTIEDAKRAGLLDKDNWKYHPKQMLYARASTVLGRNMFADVLKGLHAREEIEDSIGVTTAKAEPENITPVAPKFDEFVYDINKLDEAKREKARQFCESNKFEHLGDGFYKSIIDSKKLAACRVQLEGQDEIIRN